MKKGAWRTTHTTLAIYIYIYIYDKLSVTVNPSDDPFAELPAGYYILVKQNDGEFITWGSMLRYRQPGIIPNYICSSCGKPWVGPDTLGDNTTLNCNICGCALNEVNFPDDWSTARKMEGLDDMYKMIVEGGPYDSSDEDD